MNVSTTLRTLVVALLCSLAAAPSAQPVPVQYNVTHFFNVAPWGNVIPQVRIVHFEHAWAQEINPNSRAFQVVPAVQPFLFRPYGVDALNPFTGQVWNSGGVWANQASVVVPPIGTPAGGFNSFAFAMAQLGSLGWAGVRVIVNPFGVGMPITGSTNARGIARIVLGPPQIASAYAFSKADVRYRMGWQFPFGFIWWRPEMIASRVAGSAFTWGQIRTYDPITYEIQDPTGAAPRKGTLLHVESSIEDGLVDWNTSGLKVHLINGRFMLDQRNKFVHPQGMMAFEVKDGMVTFSYDEGAFEGMLPPTGSPGDFLVPIPELLVNYDLAPIMPQGADYEISMGGGGEENPAIPLHGRVKLDRYGPPPSNLYDWHPETFLLEVLKTPDTSVIERHYPSVDSFGDYNVPVEAEEFMAAAMSGPTFLRRMEKIPQGVAGPGAKLDFFLWNGDCDRDNAVTVFDYAILSDAFDSWPGAPNWDARADLDGDESVTVFDYSILSDNFDKVGD